MIRIMEGMSVDRKWNRFKNIILGCPVFGGHRDVEGAKKHGKEQPVKSEGNQEWCVLVA